MGRGLGIPVAALVAVAALAGAAPARGAVVVATSGTKVSIAQTGGGTEAIYLRQTGLNLIVSTTRNGPPVTGGTIPVAPIRKVVIDMRASGAYPEVLVENVNAPEIDWAMIGRTGNDSVGWTRLRCRRLQVQLGRGVDTLRIGLVSIGLLSHFDGGDDADRFLLSSEPAIADAEVRIRRFEVLDFD